MSKDIKKTTLENGLTIITKKTTTLPIITLKIFLKSGSVYDPPGQKGLANLTLSVLSKGTKKRTNEQIAEEIESLGSSIGIGCGEDFCDIGMGITRKNLKKGFEILADVLLNPTFPQEEIEKEKVVVLAAIKSRQDHIFNVAYDELRKNMFGEHPYAGIPLGVAEDIKNISRDDLINWHKKHLTAPNMLLVVTGNITLFEIKKLIKEYLPDLSSEKVSQIEIKPVLPIKKEITEKKNFEQAYVMFGYTCPAVVSDDYIKLKLLDFYLGGGMSSILFQELREKAGLGYEVNSFYSSKKYESPFVIYIGLDEKFINKAEEKVKTLVEEVKYSVDSKHLQDAKNHLEGVYLLDHQSSSKQGWYLGRWEVLGKGYEYDSKYVSELKKVTAQDVMEVAKKYLTENFVLIKLEAKND
ncbi:MAG: pitrilysin family protein [Elusimicrobiota bacterium]